MQQWGYGDKRVDQVPMVKYNFIGVQARLWLPTGPEYGLISVSVDGQMTWNISLYAPTERNSSVVWQWREPLSKGNADADDDGGGPQQLEHAHAVVIRWRAPPPPPPSATATADAEHPPFIKWVEAPGHSAVFGVPITGLPNAPVLGTNISHQSECRALCEARDDCTMYVVQMDNGTCWDPGTPWCSVCFGRTDLVWDLHDVPGTLSARRVAVHPPPAPPAPPGPHAQGQMFPADVLEYLPAFTASSQLGDETVEMSNIEPVLCGGNDPTTAECDIDSGTTGRIVNAHDGNLVQDEVSGAYYLYGVSFPDSCTSTEYDNCVSAGSCMAADQLKVTAYRSTDLKNWDLASGDLGVKSFGDQANVIYNKHTKKYVSIYRGPVGAMAALPVAVADGPVGPFTQLPAIPTGGDKVISQAAWHADEQGRAYAMFNTPGPVGTFFPAKQVRVNLLLAPCSLLLAPRSLLLAPRSLLLSVFKQSQLISLLTHNKLLTTQCLIELTPDWTNATGRKRCWVPSDGFGLEGGAVWDRNGLYYWAAGSPCCNCEEGGSARVYVATDPMGNWTQLTNMNPPRQSRPPIPP